MHAQEDLGRELSVHIMQLGARLVHITPPFTLGIFKNAVCFSLVKYSQLPPTSFAAK